MLDLELTLEYIERNNKDMITHKIYQKPLNIYQYIPTQSEHPTSLYDNFVLQELKRYKFWVMNAMTVIFWYIIETTILIMFRKHGRKIDEFSTKNM